MSSEPSTTVSSAAHAEVVYNKEKLQEVVGTAVRIMQLKVAVPVEFRGCNISRWQPVSIDDHIIWQWYDEHSEPESRFL